ncbi:hypothetical protein B0J14DRAFT_701211 [Halenospora varia]|nr:hypothetical protein B0J14DRAFT_701211 [Halenospora varia]
MASNPSSTCATVGSTHGTYLSSSAPSSYRERKDVNEQARLSAQRQAAFASTTSVSSHPSYQHQTGTASVQAHTTAMAAYLDSFDVAMTAADTST